MSWSKVDIKIGRTINTQSVVDGFATQLRSIGVIKNNSTILEASDGDVLEAIETGGKRVAYEENDGSITITTRIIEPTFELESYLTGASEQSGELTVKTLVIGDDFSVQITPKNIGGTGIRIRKAHLSYKPGYSEEEGQYADLTITVLACEDGELYTKFKKSGGAQLSISPSSIEASVAAGGEVSKTFVVHGSGLTGNVALTVSDTDTSANYFTADKSTLTPVDGEVSAEVTLTYADGAAGSHTGILTATNGTASATATLVVTEAAE